MAGSGAGSGWTLTLMSWALSQESRTCKWFRVRGHLPGASQGHYNLCLRMCVPADMHPTGLAVVTHYPSPQTPGSLQTLSHLQALFDKGAVVTLEQEGRGRKAESTCLVLLAGMAS